MREKFQQRKTLTAAEPSKTQSAASAAGGGGTGTNTKQNFNASFSAMNSSLQQKWKAVQSKQGNTRETVAAAGGAGPGLSNTMAPGAGQSRFSTEVGAPTQALSTSNNAGAAAAGQGESGASN